MLCYIMMLINSWFHFISLHFTVCTRFRQRRHSFCEVETTECSLICGRLKSRNMVTIYLVREWRRRSTVHLTNLHSHCFHRRSNLLGYSGRYYTGTGLVRILQLKTTNTILSPNRFKPYWRLNYLMLKVAICSAILKCKPMAITFFINKCDKPWARSVHGQLHYRPVFVNCVTHPITQAYYYDRTHLHQQGILTQSLWQKTCLSIKSYPINKL